MSSSIKKCVFSVICSSALSSKCWNIEKRISLEMSGFGQSASLSVILFKAPSQTLAPSPPTLSFSARDSGAWSLIGGEMIPWRRTEPGLELDTIYLVSVKFFCHFLSVCLAVENLFELFQLLPQNKCSSSFFIPAWKIDFRRQDLSSSFICPLLR